MPKKNSDPEQLSFKEAFQELETLTREFERGEIDLEEGIKKFERGLYLSSICKEKLKQVENKIIDIKEQFNHLE